MIRDQLSLDFIFCNGNSCFFVFPPLFVYFFLFFPFIFLLLLGYAKDFIKIQLEHDRSKIMDQSHEMGHKASQCLS